MDRDTKTALFVAGGVLVVGGAVAYALRGRVAVSGPRVVGTRGAAVGAQVQQEWNADGTHPQLRAFLTEWKRSGPFGLFVPKGGGLRTDAAEQARLFAEGASKARTLLETSHGRGAGLDAYPVLAGRIYGGSGELDWPRANELFDAYGARAEAFGLVWGGRWVKSFPPGPKNPKGGDRPHIEVPGWESLPVPNSAKVA